MEVRAEEKPKEEMNTLSTQVARDQESFPFPISKSKIKVCLSLSY